MENAPQKFTVYIDDNFEYMLPEGRTKQGGFDTYEEAVVVCKKIVDDFLAKVDPVGGEEEILKQYKTFGVDPWVSPEPNGRHFSAWEYAAERARAIAEAILAEDALFAGLILSERGGEFSVYLINNTAESYPEAEVITGGFATSDDDLMETDTGRRDLGPVPMRTAVLIEKSDRADLDFVIWYQLNLKNTAGVWRRYNFQLPKYGLTNAENLKQIPVLEQKGLIIKLEKKVY